MQDDKYMNPNDKARWTYTGTAKKVEIGKETVGETGGVEHVRSEPNDDAARNNGGGADAPKSTAKKAAK